MKWRRISLRAGSGRLLPTWTNCARSPGSVRTNWRNEKAAFFSNHSLAVVARFWASAVAVRYRAATARKRAPSPPSRLSHFTGIFHVGAREFALLSTAVLLKHAR